MSWEAGLAILRGASSDFWVHVRDDRFRYTALHVGAPSEPRALGLDSEAYGPIDDNLAAGGLAWRLNVFEGDWRVPAGLYRDWLWRAYGLEARQRERRPWVQDLGLAVLWCPGDVAVLEAFARRVAPGRVLLHYPGWRTDAYDENYPTFVASEKGRAFIARARGLGFHVMPHFNSVSQLDLETVFIDVTLVSQNVHNGLVEGTTSTEGMRKLIDHVAGLSFAQARFRT